MVYEIGCSNCETIYLPESKQSFNHDQMIKKDLSTVGKKITTLTGSKNILIGKTSYFLEKSKKLFIL